MTWPFPPFPTPIPAKEAPVKFNPENFEESPWHRDWCLGWLPLPKRNMKKEDQK